MPILHWPCWHVLGKARLAVDQNRCAYWSDYAGAVGSHESGLALRLEDVGDADHVVLRDTLGDADNKRDLGGNGLLDTGGGDWGRHEDGRCGSASGLDGLGDIGKDGLAQVSLSGLLGVGASDNVGAVLNGLSSVEGALLSGEALVDDLGLVVDAKVSNRRSVGRRARRVLAAARGSAQSRGQRLPETLHYGG